MKRGSIRRSVRISRTADDVWSRIGDPGALAEWFPGVASVAIDGDTRIVTTNAGIPIPERIVTNDALQRRFQYTVVGPMMREHLSTLDVHDLGDGTALVTYAADAFPAVMALVIAGAAGHALECLRDEMEQE